jgi:hypothetical protein
VIYDSDGDYDNVQFRVGMGNFLYNLDWLSFTHGQIVNHPMHIHLSDKDGRKIMYLQKHIDYLVQNKLVKEMGIKNLIEFSSKSV